ncbi:hypothetical protein DICPUDRAFT_147651 [Dictyostelium purpureum]|uniref:Guanylate-binding protein N-terminal domain-containing protein n=1 Tax=Dictyostelium purpureum TaxID=5786 RepID=F0Z918_DICPU|nr:uncharacterized protein DICPUDRAFT_147651 [Dictyostelium purpureum]EGC39584.1 hypothetical protein DICPUDRAFT_147651 [Dictyostelium purpureum]|eukprot:XP_003283919.1 hypothetical protein DICPUDRAFT_147651 [Dictyostelium purpureum]
MSGWIDFEKFGLEGLTLNNYRNYSKNSECYDIVVKINSILDISNGWEVSYPLIEQFKKSKEFPSLYAKFQTLLSNKPSGADESEIANKKKEIKGENNKRAVVSVLGLYNKGKSYVLSRILGLKLLSSFFEHTEGLSILLSRADVTEVLIGLDTKGSQKPVKNCDEAKMKDSEATERFLQTLSLNLSDIVLIVVDRLTRDDQLYIKQIKQTFRNKENIIIVHNLSHVKLNKDLEKVIKEEIVDCFDCKVKQLKDSAPYWYENDRTRHVVMACDDKDSESKIYSEAGAKMNQPTIELLQSWLKTAASTSLERFNLVDNITKFSNKVISNYLNQKVEVVLNTEETLIKTNQDPCIPCEELKYADIRFNLVGLISENPNTSLSRVSEDQDHYYVSLECYGYEIEDLDIKIEIVNSTKKIIIKSDLQRKIENRKYTNTIRDEFKTTHTRPLEWSFEFPILINEQDASDIKEFDLTNGLLHLTLTKKKVNNSSKLQKK